MARRLKFSLGVFSSRLFAPTLLLEARELFSIDREDLSTRYLSSSPPKPIVVVPAHLQIQPNPNGILKNSYRIIEACAVYCHHWITIFLRAFYLTAAFAPPAVLSPLLLYRSTSSAWWDILRNAITSSGPCMTKLAQWIATRPDLFPLEICLQLQCLQSIKRPTSYNRVQIEQLLQRELQRGNRYQDITLDGTGQELVTLGSGCVAQVVRGRLKLPNESLRKTVAIKLVHPHLRDSIETDMRILAALVYTAESLLPGLRAFSLRQSVQEFATLLQSQLDMDLEAQNLVKFRRNFNIETLKEGGTTPTSPVRPYSRFISFPRTFPRYCSESVLVEEFVGGQLISEVIADPRTSEAARRVLGDLGLTAILKMVFEDNFFHAGVLYIYLYVLFSLLYFFLLF